MLLVNKSLPVTRFCKQEGSFFREMNATDKRGSTFRSQLKRRSAGRRSATSRKISMGYIVVATLRHAEPLGVAQLTNTAVTGPLGKKDFEIDKDWGRMGSRGGGRAEL